VIILAGIGKILIGGIMSGFNNQLQPYQPGLYGSDFSKYNMGTYFKTADDIKRDSDNLQFQMAFQRSSTGNGTDWGLYQSNLQRAGLINKNALPKGFKNQYYDDAIANPDKYTWGVWDASKDQTTDNWQPKPRVAGDARDTAKKVSVFTTTVTSQPAKFAQTANLTPTTQQLTPTVQQSENNQPSHFSNTSSLLGVDSLANQNNKPKNYFDTNYFSN
jgi:hypothetical protein